MFGLFAGGNLVKYLLLAVLAGAAGWFYLIDGSKLDEGMVREFYAQQANHTYARDPEALCEQLGRSYRMNIRTRLAGKVSEDNYGKSAACDQIRKSFKFFAEMGEEFMQIFSESTDRIERSMRKVQLVAQDAKVHMRWTPGAVAHPEQYFQAQ
jgi:hypothetical protein